MGGAIFLWFLFNIILPIVFLGLLLTSIDFNQVIEQQAMIAPDWYHVLNFLNPTSVYSSILSSAIGPISSISGGIPTPDWYSAGLLVGVLFVWIFVFFIVGLWRFQRKDI
jgi:ABC-type transport system involved in multi-copper enzyme maturation permease subunit